MHLSELKKSLRALGDPAAAEHAQRFFKTGPGEYGDGDRFLGIRVPVLRQQARQFGALKLIDLEKLLSSPWHEERLCALFILVDQYSRGSEEDKSAIYSLYLANTQFINNWDLVDSSAHKIVGHYLEQRDRSELYRLVLSRSLWERRISMIASYHFIRKNDFDDSFRLAEQLLCDQEDLIHKAVGWMLREIGKRDQTAEEAFLEKHYRVMPRTMLRYAIEKFESERRQAFLKGKV